MVTPSGAVKPATLLAHQESVTRALTYSRDNFQSPIDVATISTAAHVSSFHFNRLFQAAVGESIGEHLRRVRLEWAAGRLVASTDAVTEIAIRAGYENPESFTRAFSRLFGISPSQFRDTRQSSILQAPRLPEPLLPNQTVPFKPDRVLYTTHFGSYNSVGPTWQALLKYVYQKGYVRFWQRPQLYGIPYCPPDITPESKLQYDACVVVNDKAKPEGSYGLRTLPAGSYLQFIHVGSYDKLATTYASIFRWVYENEISLRDTPCLERYLNDIDKTAPERLRTEIYLPTL